MSQIKEIKPGLWILDGKLTLADANNLCKEGFLLLEKSPEGIEVDLSGVDVTGSWVLTLLLSLIKRARALQKKLVYLNATSGLRRIAKANGVLDILGLD